LPPARRFVTLRGHRRYKPSDCTTAFERHPRERHSSPRRTISDLFQRSPAIFLGHVDATVMPAGLLQPKNGERMPLAISLEGATGRHQK
jgi:hypothetical protein